jgi:hypothetical protein
MTAVVVRKLWVDPAALDIPSCHLPRQSFKHVIPVSISVTIRHRAHPFLAPRLQTLGCRDRLPGISAFLAK